MITEPHSSDTLGKKQTKHLIIHQQASSLECPLVKYPGAAQQCMGVINTATPTYVFPEVSVFNMFAMCSENNNNNKKLLVFLKNRSFL